MKFLWASALILLMGCLSACAETQIFQLSAGASTAYDAEGGSLAIHGANSETTIGAGVLGGHSAAGGTSRHSFHGGVLTTGQQQILLDLPTDLFETSHVFSGTGVSYRRTPAVAGKGTFVTVFAGANSQDSGSPLFGSDDGGSGAALVQAGSALDDRCRQVTTATLSEIYSVLVSVECGLPGGVTLATSTGVGARAPYAAVSMHRETARLKLKGAWIYASPNFQRSSGEQQLLPEPAGGNAAATWRAGRSVSVSGMHERFFTAPSVQGAPTAEKSSIDDASIDYSRHGQGLSLTVIHSSFSRGASALGLALSSTTNGVTAGYQREFGAWRWSEQFFASRSEGSPMETLLVSSVSARVNAHLEVSGAVNLSDGRATFSQGGELRTAFSSFRLDYQMFYSPAQPQQPFQQAAVFSAELRPLRRLVVSASSSVDPLGHLVYTFRLGTQFARHEAAGGSGGNLMRSSLSQYVAQGVVVDTAGAPIAGAALLIANQRIYTDSTGSFSYRDTHPGTRGLRVLISEFLDPGEFAVVEGPATITTSANNVSEVRIVVAKIPRHATGGSR